MEPSPVHDRRQGSSRPSRRGRQPVLWLPGEAIPAAKGGLVRWSTALDVLGVLLVAAVVSDEHASDLLQAHGATGRTARPILLIVAGVIYGSWMMMLDSAPQDAGSALARRGPATSHERNHRRRRGAAGVLTSHRARYVSLVAECPFRYGPLQRNDDSVFRRGPTWTVRRGRTIG